MWIECNDSGFWCITSPSPLPLPQPRYAPHSVQLGLLELLSIWLSREALGNSVAGSQKAQMTRTSCNCIYNRVSKCPSSSSSVPCACPREPLPSQPRIQRLRAGLTAPRLLNVVSHVLFLRPAEPPELLELTEQLRDKRLREKQVRLRLGITPTHHTFLA